MYWDVIRNYKTPYMFNFFEDTLKKFGGAQSFYPRVTLGGTICFCHEENRNSTKEVFLLSIFCILMGFFFTVLF